MADIAALFDDALTEVKLKHPKTGDDVGISMWIAPFEADATVDWWVRTTAQMERVKAGSGDVSEDRIAEIDAKANIKRAIAAVRKWNWGGNSFGNLGQDPVLSEENKQAIFNDPRASWIVAQIIDAGLRVENFTEKPKAD